jgi:putative two-component system response regulator
VALADVFDALTCVRPYKRAWSVAEAVEEVVRCREKHFDPRVVEAFLRRIPEMTAVQQENIDKD